VLLVREVAEAVGFRARLITEEQRRFQRLPEQTTQND
jgi:hypothetical protein